MNPDVAIQRAQLLIEQDRYEQANDLLRGALAMEPDNADAHGYLAICLMQNRDQLHEATREAQQAIHLEPADPFGHYIHALVLEKRNLEKEAIEAIQQAIQLSPTNAHFHGVHASLLAQNGDRWKDALAAAEVGLSYDPENEQCASIRSIALERVGRVGDAVAEAQRSIRNSPDSSHSHASLGWALVQKGDYRQAQDAFREALRLEPANEFARQGMMTALNSSNPIYRFFNGLLIRISRLDSKVQMGLFIGLWIGIKVLNSLAQTYPWLSPWVFPISIFYLLFVMMAWIIQPLFNTFLRFSKFGRYLLSPKEKWASNLIGGSLVMGIVLGSACAILHGEPIFFFLPAMHAVFLTIPISVAFNAEADWARAVAIAVAIAFTGLYLFNTGLLLIEVLILPFMMAYTYGILIYCFVGGHLANAKDRIA